VWRILGTERRRSKELKFGGWRNLYRKAMATVSEYGNTGGGEVGQGLSIRKLKDLVIVDC